MIDLYCERIAPGLLAEPLNALSNLLFIVAAIVIATRAITMRQTDTQWLCLLLMLIGIGSGLFHTFATSWSQWADVIPIALFQLTYLGLFLSRLLGFQRHQCALILISFSASLGIAGQSANLLNGSLAYLPAALVLLVLGVNRWRVENTPTVFIAAAIFLLSLTARSVDLALCSVWPYGTHFVWHALNALVLGLVLNAYCDSRYRLAGLTTAD